MSDKCKRVIHGDWGRWHQCRNSAKREGYCGMHHPDAVKARQEKSTKLYEENREKSDSYRLKKALATIATLTEQVRALILDKNMFELEAEEAECAMMHLDDMGIARKLGDNTYSLVGRINLIATPPKEAE